MSASPSTRDLRERLEATQGRVKALREALSTQDPQTPREEDLERLSRLETEVEQLELRRVEATRQRDLAALARAGAEKLALREERPPLPSAALLPAALAVGLLGGALLCFWWLDAPFGRQQPLLAAGLGCLASGAFLLRAAWRLGRLSGAREL